MTTTYERLLHDLEVERRRPLPRSLNRIWRLPDGSLRNQLDSSEDVRRHRADLLAATERPGQWRVRT